MMVMLPFVVAGADSKTCLVVRRQDWSVAASGCRG